MIRGSSKSEIDLGNLTGYLLIFVLSIANDETRDEIGVKYKICVRSEFTARLIP